MASSSTPVAHSPGAACGIGFFEALVWSGQVASDFSGSVWGFVETLAWPGFLVNEMVRRAG